MEMWVKQCSKYFTFGMDSHTIYIRQMHPLSIIACSNLVTSSYNPIPLKDLLALYLLCDLFFLIFIKVSHIRLGSAIRTSPKMAKVESNDKDFFTFLSLPLLREFCIHLVLSKFKSSSVLITVIFFYCM